MHRHVALPLSLALAIGLTWAGTAAADPGAPPNTAPGATAPAQPGRSRSANVVAPAHAGQSLLARTHSFVFPNGNLLPKGEVTLRSDMFGLWNTISVGVTDRIELHASSPIVPVLASAGVRVGLLGGSSPLRVAVGLSGWLPLGKDMSGYAVSGTVTAAYSTERLNLHATVGVMRGSEGDAMPHTYDVGASYRLGDKVALLGEAVSLWIPTGETCAANYSSSTSRPVYGGGCSDPGDTLDAVVVGAKLMGEHYDADVGLLLPRRAIGGTLRALPVASVSYRF